MGLLWFIIFALFISAFVIGTGILAIALADTIIKWIL